MVDFDITIGNGFDGEEILFSSKTGSVKSATSNSSSNYECFTNNTNKINGSFLFIRNQNDNSQLEICDIIVEGYFIQFRSFSISILIFFFFTILFSIKLTETFQRMDLNNLPIIHGLVWADFKGINTVDGNFNTHYHSAGDPYRYKKPFLLFDLKEEHVINGVIVVRSEGPSIIIIICFLVIFLFFAVPYLQNMFVVVENIPSTFYLSKAKYCFRGGKETSSINHALIIMWCNEQNSGLFYQDSSTFFIFVEFFVFARKSSIEEIKGVIFGKFNLIFFKTNNKFS